MPAKIGRRVSSHHSAGRQQALASNPQVQNALYKQFNTKAAPLDLSTQQFRVEALLRSQQRKLVLNNYLLSLSWQDLSGQAWLGGQLSARTVAAGSDQHLQIKHGDVVRNSVFWGGEWIRLWEMRVWDPDRTLEAASPQIDATIYDDLHLLSISQDDFHFHNVYCHEIIQYVGTKYQVPLGRVAMGTYKIKTFDQKGISPLDAIILGYQMERQHTGKKFVLRWNNGKMEVTPLRRNKLLYVMHDQLIDTTIHHTTPTNFATSLTGRATLTSGKSNKVHKESYTAQQSVDAYGFIHQQQDYAQNYNEGQLVNAVKHDLAKRQVIGHSVDFDHQGIALVRKGDAVEVLIPEEGYTGSASIVWVSDITHTLTPSSYMMQPTVVASDPVGMPEVVAKVYSHRARRTKRIKRKRTVTHGHKSKHRPTGGTSPSVTGTTDPAQALQGLLSGGTG